MLVGAAAFLSSVLLGSFFYIQTSKNALNLQTNELAAETRLLTSSFSLVFGDLQTDILALYKTPPISGIIRSVNNKGKDPVSRLTTKQWKERLEEFFIPMLEANPSYVQIRYIGIADNGRELVRVNKNNTDIQAVTEKDLQQKKEEFYFQEISSLPPETTYFSTVTLNREHGKIEYPFLPVIRTGIPVYDNQKLFGMIVINASYEKILQNVIDRMEPQKNVYVFNEKGDFILYDKKSLSSNFFFKSLGTKPEVNPFITPILNSSKTEDTVFININGKITAVHYSKLFFNPSNKKQFLVSAMGISEHSLLAPVYNTQLHALYLIIAMVLFTSVAAALFSLYQLRPLKQMTKELKNFSDESKNPNLPIYLKDEIGDLSRAFQSLFEKLKKSRHAETKALVQLQSIVDNTVEGLITINQMGIVESYNKACEEMFGYDAKEVVGQNIKVLMPDPYRTEHDGYLRKYHDTKNKKIIGTIREVQGMKKDGTIFPIDLSVSEVTVEGQTLYSGIVRDISERKKAEEEIMRSNAELERFAYIASHDLQEPLRMVSSFTNLLNEEYNDRFDKQAEEYMTFIMDASHRMQNLIGDLLEYSRIGYEDAGFTDVDALSHTNLAISNLQEIIGETGAQISVSDLPTIHANPIRFSRLMQNLIGNAIKYRDKSRTPIISVEAKDNKNEWIFSVQDNGIGMKEEYLEKIFVIFKRLHGKNEYSGTGIGLAVCKKIVESFHGRIWAESNSGSGSVFYFTIPKQKTERIAA